MFDKMMNAMLMKLFANLWKSLGERIDTGVVQGLDIPVNMSS